MGKAGEDLL
jgi:hypothetical protein